MSAYDPTLSGHEWAAFAAMQGLNPFNDVRVTRRHETPGVQFQSSTSLGRLASL
jgi:hypothetical protein